MPVRLPRGGTPGKAEGDGGLAPSAIENAGAPCPAAAGAGLGSMLFILPCARISLGITNPESPAFMRDFGVIFVFGCPFELLLKKHRCCG